jgi:hypothetical protein
MTSVRSLWVTVKRNTSLYGQPAVEEWKIKYDGEVTAEVEVTKENAARPTVQEKNIDREHIPGDVLTKAKHQAEGFQNA